METDHSGKDIIILYNSIPYFIEYFERKNIIAQHPFKKASLLSKVVKRLFRLIKLPETFWYGEWKKSISSCKVVIAIAPLRINVMKYILKANSNIRIIYWYWDSTFRIGSPSSAFSDLAELWSFDPKDCEKFGMNFNTTFYFRDIQLPSNRMEYDAIFLGLNKGRRGYLNNLEKRLSDQGIRTYFHIVPDKHETKRHSERYIPYDRYLEILSKSRAIIDVIPEGQSGMTIRSMESIFFSKKLITTILSITSEDFYSKENIFIFGKDNVSDIKDFINGPYFKLPDHIVEKYDFSNWLKRFNI